MPVKGVCLLTQTFGGERSGRYFIQTLLFNLILLPRKNTGKAR